MRTEPIGMAVAVLFLLASGQACAIRSGGRSLAGQLLEFLQALALFVQQALLAVADQVAVAGGGEGGGAGCAGRGRPGVGRG